MLKRVHMEPLREDDWEILVSVTVHLRGVRYAHISMYWKICSLRTSQVSTRDAPGPDPSPKARGRPD